MRSTESIDDFHQIRVVSGVHGMTRVWNEYLARVVLVARILTVVLHARGFMIWILKATQVIEAKFLAIVQSRGGLRISGGAGNVDCCFLSGCNGGV